MRQENNRKSVIGVRLMTGAALVALLAGCSSIPDAVNPATWFESDSPATAERRAAADSSYPNLSTVPERPTGGSTAEERRALRQGLLADRERARYTDDQPANVIQPGVEEKTTQRAPRSTAPVSVPAPAATRQPTPPAAEPAPAPVAAPVSVPEPAAPVVTQQPSATPERTSGQVATTSRDAALPGRSGTETSDPAAPQPPATRRGSVPVPAPAEVPAPVATPAAEAPPAAVPAPEPRVSAVGPMQAVPAPAAAPVSASAPAPVPAATPPAAPAARTVEEIYREQFAQSAPQATLPPQIAANPGASALPQAIPQATATGVSYQAGTVYFGHGSFNLSAEDRSLIRGIAERYKQSGGLIRVIGHASSRTRDMRPVQHAVANLEVSARRAEVVAQELRKAGVPATAMDVRGIGDNQPVYHEVMPAGEAGNRRVEIFLDY